MLTSNNLYSYKFQHNLKVASIILNYIVLFLAVLVLCGWHFDLVYLRKPFSRFVSMNPLTAICLMLSALSMIFLVKKRLPGLTKLFAFIILIIGVSEVLEFSSIYTIGIDNLLYRSKTSHDIVNNQSNVMAPITAVNFVITGTSILLLSAKFRVNLSQYLTLIMLCLSLFSLIGYIYGVAPFYSFFAYYPMAIHTAFSFVLLAVSILFARSSKGFMSEFISPYGGSKLARQLLPMAIIVPITLGLLRLYGEQQGLYNRSFGIALYTSLIIFIFAGFIWKSMASINRLSYILSEEKARLKSNQLADLIMNAALDAIICIDKEGKISLWNPRAEKIFGWKKEEVLGRSMAEVIIPVQLRQKHNEGMGQYLRTGRAKILNTVILTTAIDRNNRELEIELAITKIRYRDNEIFCGFIRDITESLKHLHDIEEQNKKLKDIAWTQSHLVRAPVANLIGLLKLMSDPSLDKATFTDILKLMNVSVKQLDDIIRDIVNKSATI